MLLVLLAALMTTNTLAQSHTVYIQAGADTNPAGVLSFACLGLSSTVDNPYIVNAKTIAISHSDKAAPCIIFLVGGSWNGRELTLAPEEASMELSSVSTVDPISSLIVNSHATNEQSTLTVRGRWHHCAVDIHSIATINLDHADMTDVIMSFPYYASVNILESSFAYSMNAITSSTPITSLVGGRQSLTARGALPFAIGLNNDIATNSSSNHNFTTSGATLTCIVTVDGYKESICESFLDITGAGQSHFVISGFVNGFPTIVTGTPAAGATTIELKELTLLRQPLAFTAASPFSLAEYYSLPMISSTGYDALKISSLTMNIEYEATPWSLFGSSMPNSLDMSNTPLKNMLINVAPSSGTVPKVILKDLTLQDCHLHVQDAAILAISNVEFQRTTNYSVAKPTIMFRNYAPSALNQIDSLRATWMDETYIPRLFSTIMPHLMLWNSTIALNQTSSRVKVDNLGLIDSSFFNGSLEVRLRIDPYTFDDITSTYALGPSTSNPLGFDPLPVTQGSLRFLQVPALTIRSRTSEAADPSFLTLHPVEINGVQINSRIPVLYKYSIPGRAVSLTGISPRLWNATFPLETDLATDISPSSIALNLAPQKAVPLPRFDIAWVPQSGSFPNATEGETYPMLKIDALNQDMGQFMAVPQVQASPMLTNDTTDYRHLFMDSSRRWINFYYGALCPIPKPSPPELFTCASGTWIYSPPTGGVPSAPSTSPSTSSSVVIVVSAPVTVVGDFDTTGISFVFPGLNTTISVQGCANLPSNVTIQLTLEEIQQLSGETAYLLIKTNCTTPISTSSSALIINKDENSCRKVRGRLESRQTGIVALFDIDDSGCKSSNRWWIILVSVICGVLLVVIILVLIFTLIPAARRAIRPYSARKDQKEAASANLK